MKISLQKTVLSVLSVMVILVTILLSTTPVFAKNDGTAKYTVQRGETLTLIAKKFGLTVEKILAVNPEIKDANNLLTGQIVILPSGRSEGLSAAKEGRLYVWQLERDGGRVEKEDRLYLAKNGDTLTRIATRYGISLEKLLQANPQISDSNQLFRGELVHIPDGRGEIVPLFYETPRPVPGENK